MNQLKIKNYTTVAALKDMAQIDSLAAENKMVFVIGQKKPISARFVKCILGQKKQYWLDRGMIYYVAKKSNHQIAEAALEHEVNAEIIDNKAVERRKEIVANAKKIIENGQDEVKATAEELNWFQKFLIWCGK